MYDIWPCIIYYISSDSSSSPIEAIEMAPFQLGDGEKSRECFKNLAWSDFLK